MTVLQNAILETYDAPFCEVIFFTGEADVCAGTNEAGYGYVDDEELGDI